MARSISEIEASIIAQKNTEAELSELNSTSKLAIWRLWVKVVAAAHFILESLWDSKAKELEDLANKAIVGNNKWYAQKMLEFQYGYSLSEIDGRLVYLIDDPTARIIKKSAISTAQGVLIIKVAKEISGELVKLSNVEKVSAESYINDIKFAGTSHLLVSEDADLVHLRAIIYFDGKLILNDFKTAMEAAINNHLKNIEFNGILSLNKLRDSMELVPGQLNGPDITLLAVKPFGESYINVGREFSAESGYFKIDPDFPLSTSLIYNAV